MKDKMHFIGSMFGVASGISGLIGKFELAYFLLLICVGFQGIILQNLEARTK